MPSFRHVSWIALAALVLAGCGGGGAGTSALPAAVRAPSAVRPLVGSPPAPAGTLYVADHWGVFAYPLSASDPATSQRSIVPHPSQIDTELIQGLATAPDGTLAILQNYFTGPADDESEYCRTVIEPADAGSGISALGTYPCDLVAPTQGEAIARGANGFDLVYRIGGGFSIQHLGENGTVSGTMALPAGLYDGIATTSTGSDYVSDIAGNVLKYGAGATDSTVSLGHVVVPGPVAVQAIATAPDHTLYAAAGPLGNQFVYAYPQGASSPSRTLGPYTNNYVTSLAVDAQGELYVAMTALAGGSNLVRVYAADADGKPTPLRTITNPVPSSYEIIAIAIAQ